MILLICLQRGFSESRDMVAKCSSTLCPKFSEEKLRKRLDDAAKMNVLKVNHFQYKVVHG